MLLLADAPERLRAKFKVVAYVLLPAAAGFSIYLKFGALFGAIAWLVTYNLVLLCDYIQKTRDRETWELRAMPGVVITLMELLWPDSDFKKRYPGARPSKCRGNAPSLDEVVDTKKSRGGLRRRKILRNPKPKVAMIGWLP